MAGVSVNINEYHATARCCRAGRLSTTGRGLGAAELRDVYSPASNRGTPPGRKTGALSDDSLYRICDTHSLAIYDL